MEWSECGRRADCMSIMAEIGWICSLRTEAPDVWNMDGFMMAAFALRND